MKAMFLKKNIVQPKSLLLIFIVTALLVISLSLIELSQSKKEMLELMENQSHVLLESLMTSSENAIISYDKLEHEVENRLLNNAVMIRTMFEKGLVSDRLLSSIASENKIFRINIFDSRANKIFSSHKEIHFSTEGESDPQKYLQPIFDDEADTLIIGIKNSKLGDGKRFAVAVASANRDAIVLNIDAEELIKFRQQVGFGILLRKTTENSNIEYAALQNEDGIIAASGITNYLEPIDSSQTLIKTLEDIDYRWRIKQNGNHEVFEALHPFVYEGSVIGIFRLGLSLQPLEDINESITRRIIILGVVLLVFGFITLTLVFTRQNFDLLSKRYTAIESYSNQIIKNANDGIIVMDSDLRIKIINNAALDMFEMKNENVIEKDLSQILNGENCRQILDSPSTLEQIDCAIGGKVKTILVSKSVFAISDNEKNTVLIIKDLTKQKALEKQIQRNERLVAMGELASSVAHEIRNPLNAIGTITQQLNKDFEPKENVEEYKSLSQLVHKEVKRINETIENFLRFAKPLPVHPERFNSSDLFIQIEKQYHNLLSQKKIDLNLRENWKGEVTWDRKQIQQVFINLMENAIDSVGENGNIEIAISELKKDNVEIIFSDNGKGIPKEVVNKIFNLYFTTKTKGSGIGLSVVQKIISEHNGIISVESSPGKGAAFRMEIPKFLGYSS